MKRLDVRHIFVWAFAFIVLAVLTLTEEGSLNLENSHMGRPDLWFLTAMFLFAGYWLIYYGWERWREGSPLLATNAMAVSLHHEEPFDVVSPPPEYVAAVREALKGVEMTEDEARLWGLRLGPHAIYIGFGVELARAKGDGEGYVFVAPLPLVARHGEFVDVMAKVREYSAQEHKDVDPWVLGACLAKVPRFKLLYSSVFYGYEPDWERGVVRVGDGYAMSSEVPQIDTNGRQEWLAGLLKVIDARLDSLRREVNAAIRRIEAQRPQPLAVAPTPQPAPQPQPDDRRRPER